MQPFLYAGIFMAIWVLSGIPGWAIQNAFYEKEYDYFSSQSLSLAMVMGFAGLFANIKVYGGYGMKWYRPTAAERWANYQKEYPYLSATMTFEQFIKECPQR